MNSMRSNNVLIVGGAGYIGQVLARQLVTQGLEVTVWDPLIHDNSVDDLRRYADVIEASGWILNHDHMSNYGTVINLAGLSSEKLCAMYPSVAWKVNAALPGHLLEMAQRGRVNLFIQASTASVYGRQDPHVEVAYNPRPTETYSRTKLTGERALHSTWDRKGETRVAILRQGTVCGYSPRMRWDLLVNTMYMRRETKGFIDVDCANDWRPNIFINDLAFAYYQLIMKRDWWWTDGCHDMSFRTWDVASENELIGDTALRVANNECPVKRAETQKRGRSYRVDIHEIWKDLGWHPECMIPQHTVRVAVNSIVEAKRLPNFVEYGTSSAYNERAHIRRA